jgi:hypothetical protein
MTEMGFNIGLMFIVFLLGSLIFSCIWIWRIIFFEDQPDQSDFVMPQQTAALEFIIQSYAEKEPTRKI